MCSKCILAILVDDEAGMDGEDVPGTSEGEFLCEFLGAEVDEIEARWPVD